MNQKTLKRSFSFAGVGVHTGERAHVIVNRGAENSGYVFIRSDKKSAPRITASYKNICETRGATMIAHQGFSVQTVEHVLAALWAGGIDNAEIIIHGPEVPILDGSAKFFAERIAHCGHEVQNALRIERVVNETIIVRHNKSLAVISPSSSTQFICHGFIGNKLQSAHFMWNNARFLSRIAPARTFVEIGHIAPMRELGLLKGADEHCGILLSNGIAQNTEFTMHNECIHHKLLDAIGDFSLLGINLLAKIELYQTSHSFHRYVLDKLSQILSRALP